MWVKALQLPPMTKRLLSLSCIVVILSAFFVQAETKLPSILGSHMVLQQGEKCPIWGWDDSDKQVTVEFAGQKHTAKVVMMAVGKSIWIP